MKKKNILASLMAAVLVTVNVFSSVVFAAEEEILPAEEAVEIAEDSVEIEAETAEGLAEIAEDSVEIEAKTAEESAEDESEFEEPLSEQDIIMPVNEVGFEEEANGDGEAKFYAQPKFATKDGYDLYLCYVVDNADHNKIVASFYLVCDIGAYWEYFRYDYTVYSKDTFLSGYIEKTSETMDVLYMPLKVADRRDDIEGTALNEHLIPCLTQAEATAMLSDWKEWQDVPVLKDTAGHIGYMTTGGIQYPSDNGKAVTDADTSTKDDDSSSKKDDSSSSGKDDGSSSSKDDSSSSSKDGGSSSSKDDSSSSSKDDSSSSSKDDGSTAVDPTKDSNIVTHKFTAAGREYEIRWSDSVSYNGKKHIAKGMMPKRKETADVFLELYRDGVKLELGSQYKVKFYNNRKVNKPKRTPAYYNITLDKEGFCRAERRAVAKKWLGFDIKAAEAVSGNIVAKKPAKVRNGRIKVRLQYKFPEGVVSIKPRTYDCEYSSSDGTVTIHLYGYIKGTVKVPLAQLQK